MPGSARKSLYKLAGGLAIFVLSYWLLTLAARAAIHSYTRTTTVSVSVPMIIEPAPEPAAPTAQPRPAGPAGSGDPAAAP